MPFQIKGFEIIPIRGMHYKLPVLGFRIGEIAYLTDFNSISAQEIEKIKGVDTLVINALRKEPHLSHFTLDEALHVSYLVGPRHTYLTHVSLPISALSGGQKQRLAIASIMAMNTPIIILDEPVAAIDP